MYIKATKLETLPVNMVVQGPIVYFSLEELILHTKINNALS